MTMKVAPINHRWQLAELTRYQKAVEVGTHRGEFADQLVRVRYGLDQSGHRLWCVDPWANSPEYEEQAKLLVGGGQDRAGDYNECKKTLDRWLKKDLVTLKTGLSPGYAARFGDGVLDLVYLDGDHSHEAVWADLNAWWPKLRPGGVIAGHDFVCPGEGDGSPDGWGGRIQPAVLAFASVHYVDIRLVIENAPETAGHPWSFYIEKPK